MSKHWFHLLHVILKVFDKEAGKEMDIFIGKIVVEEEN